MKRALFLVAVLALPLTAVAQVGQPGPVSVPGGGSVAAGTVTVTAAQFSGTGDGTNPLALKSSSVTLQGNSFNGDSKLVQSTSDGSVCSYFEGDAATGACLRAKDDDQYQSLEFKDPSAVPHHTKFWMQWDSQYEFKWRTSSGTFITFGHDMANPTGYHHVTGTGTASAVGIGTTAPGTLLDVVGAPQTIDGVETQMVVRGAGTKAGNIYVQTPQTSSAMENGIYFGLTGSAQVGFGSIPTSSAAHITAGQNEAIRVEAGGDVGIGTTNPTSKLSVAGNVQITSTSGYYIIYASDNAAVCKKITVNDANTITAATVTCP